MIKRMNFPNSHQYLYRRNKSHLHSLWLGLYLGVYLLIVNVLWRVALKNLWTILFGFIAVWVGYFVLLYNAVRLHFEMVGYALFGYLDAEPLSMDEFIAEHLKRLAQKGQ
jgi:hypothetical protein